MGEESKVRVNKTIHPVRHTGFKAVSTGQGKQQAQTHQYPLSLDGRGIKGEGENKTVPPGPSFPRRRESTGWQERAVVILALRQYPQGSATTRQSHQHRHSRFKAASTGWQERAVVILASRQYPQGRATTRQTNRQNPPLP